MNKIVFSTLLLCGMVNVARAEVAPSADAFLPGTQFGAVMGGDFTFGGDSLLEVDLEYDDGDTGKEDISAGEFFLIFGGIYFQQNESPTRSYGAQITVGWFYDGINADNGDVSLMRYPIEVIPYVRLNKFRLGLGLTRHTGIKLDYDADFSAKAKFEDANGLVFIAEYMVTDKIGLGLRYVKIDYDFDYGGGTESFDASHVGVGATFMF